MITSSTWARMYGPKMPRCSSNSPRAKGLVKELSRYSRKTTFLYCLKGFFELLFELLQETKRYWCGTAFSKIRSSQFKQLHKPESPSIGNKWAVLWNYETTKPCPVSFRVWNAGDLAKWRPQTHKMKNTILVCRQNCKLQVCATSVCLQVVQKREVFNSSTSTQFHCLLCC